MDINEKTLSKVKEYLESDKCKKVERELKNYLETNDLATLTMLTPKYLLSLDDVNKIKNNELDIADLKIDKDIRVESIMYHGDDDEDKETGLISIEKFAKYSLEMIEYVRNNIDNEDFELSEYGMDGCDLLYLPDMNYDKPHSIVQFYKSDVLDGISNYETIQDFIIDDIVNKWTW